MLTCTTCSDTHRTTFGDREVPCTRCPMPCDACASDGAGAYCAATPCECACHGDRPRPKPVSHVIRVGQIAVSMRGMPTRAMVGVGAAIFDIGPAVAQRFAAELGKIREALDLSRRLLCASMLSPHVAGTSPCTPDEVHLARLLVDLEFVKTAKEDS